MEVILMKRIISFVLTVYIFMWVMPVMVFAQEYYQKGPYRLVRSATDVPLISQLDIKTLGERYLPGFEIHHINYLLWETGADYTFARSADDVRVVISYGLYSSVRDAEDAVLDGMKNGTSAWMNEGPYKGKSAGDNFWYSVSKSSNLGEYVVCLAFIRYNAVFRLLCMGGKIDILTLAQNIDKDILNSTSYLKMSKIISPPIIHSISAPKEVRTGDLILFTVNATDPEGMGIKYRCLYGGHEAGQPENVLGVKAYPDYFPGELSSGPHTFLLWVVNENNLFSGIKEVTVTF